MCNLCFLFKEFDHGGCPSGLGNEASDVRDPAQGLGNGDTQKLGLFAGLHHISTDLDPDVPTTLSIPGEDHEDCLLSR